jgi:hypothetical protein
VVRAVMNGRRWCPRDRRGMGARSAPAGASASEVHDPSPGSDRLPSGALTSWPSSTRPATQVSTRPRSVRDPGSRRGGDAASAITNGPRALPTEPRAAAAPNAPAAALVRWDYAGWVAAAGGISSPALTAAGLLVDVAVWRADSLSVARYETTTPTITSGSGRARATAGHRTRLMRSDT